jgi:tRNA(adenine34) deaminase
MFDSVSRFTKFAHLTQNGPSRRSFLRLASPLMAAPALADAQSPTTVVVAPQVPTLEGTEFDAKVMRSLAEFTELSFKTAGPTQFGAAIVNTATGEELMRAVNMSVIENDPSSHGEVNTIRLACKKLGSRSLKGYTLYTTVEPCGMCTMCCAYAQLDRVVYGAATPDARQANAAPIDPRFPPMRCAEILSRNPNPYILVGHVEKDRCIEIIAKLRASRAGKQPEPVK